jgi:hypothetical protein
MRVPHPEEAQTPEGLVERQAEPPGDGRRARSLGRGGTLRRWLLWLTIGALLLLQAGTVVTSRDGELLLGPGVLSGAVLVWLFVTAAVLKRRFVRPRE